MSDIRITEAERARSEAYLRISQAARDLSLALAAAQALGLSAVVEVDWVTRDDEQTQEVVAYIAGDEADGLRTAHSA